MPKQDFNKLIGHSVFAITAFVAANIIMYLIISFILFNFDFTEWTIFNPPKNIYDNSGTGRLFVVVFEVVACIAIGAWIKNERT